MPLQWRTALSHVVSSRLPALYVFHGLGPELEKPDVADLLREAARQLAGRSGAKSEASLPR